MAGAIFFFFGFLVSGLIVQRWLIVPFAAVLWPVFYGGLRLGIWGSGVGDNWDQFALALTVGSTAGAVCGVLGARVLRGGRRTDP
jgi:hypothetical protein